MCNVSKWRQNDNTTITAPTLAASLPLNTPVLPTFKDLNSSHAEAIRAYAASLISQERNEPRFNECSAEKAYRGVKSCFLSSDSDSCDGERDDDLDVTSSSGSAAQRHRTELEVFEISFPFPRESNHPYPEFGSRKATLYCLQVMQATPGVTRPQREQLGAVE